MTFHSSTLIEKIFHRPPSSRQLSDLPGFFRAKIFDRIRTRNPQRQRGEGYHREGPWQVTPVDLDPTP